VDSVLLLRRTIMPFDMRAEIYPEVRGLFVGYDIALPYDNSLETQAWVRTSCPNGHPAGNGYVKADELDAKFCSSCGTVLDQVTESRVMLVERNRGPEAYPERLVNYFLAHRHPRSLECESTVFAHIRDMCRVNSFSYTSTAYYYGYYLDEVYTGRMVSAMNSGGSILTRFSSPAQQEAAKQAAQRLKDGVRLPFYRGERVRYWEYHRPAMDPISLLPISPGT
jgi:hypothetical protein